MGPCHRRQAPHGLTYVEHDAILGCIVPLILVRSGWKANGQVFNPLIAVVRRESAQVASSKDQLCRLMCVTGVC